jgi:hypothetical protein
MGRSRQKPVPAESSRRSQPAPFASNAARQKTLPAPRMLPDGGTSGDRLCWRYRHVDHDGPWCLHKAADGDFCGFLAQLANFESMTVNEAFHRGDYPGKDYDVDKIPNAMPSGGSKTLGSQT